MFGGRVNPGRNPGAPVAASSRCRGWLRFGVLLMSVGTASLFFGWSRASAAGSSALNPKGPVASTVAHLSWTMFVIAAIVFLVVVAILVVGMFRTPRGLGGPGTAETETFRDHWLIVLGGIAIPAIILVGVFIYTLTDMVSLAKPDEPTTMTVDVIGHQWWWEVQYPDKQVTTANEIHIPVGQPIDVQLTTADVIHSFWVPQLAPKTDLIPGKTNHLRLQADTAGTYRGQCAEFCGTEHANMAFLIVADPPDRFAAWLAAQQQPAPEAANAIIQQGEQAFLGSACVYCHTVAGTVASGKVGPDLTHLASRQTLAAGTLANTPGNLAGWIANPQAIKPGNKMPAVRLDPQDFQAILAFLESLK
jgi:cytochrome c oxidase subunit 2